MTRKALFWACAGALCAVLVLSGCGAPDDNSQARSGPPPAKVVVAPVSEREFVNVVEALGTTRADESVVLTSNVADKVIEIGFEDGQFVDEGDLIVRLDDRAERADLQAARARLVERRQALARSERMIRQNVVSQAELDLARAESAATEAEVAALESAVADRTIQAPFAGRLGLREISKGALIEPGDTITTLADLDPLKIDFTVPAAQLARLEPGQAIRGRTAAFGERVFEGELASIDNRVDPVTRAVTARAFIPNPDHLLKPGMLMELELFSQRRKSLAVPEAAIVPRSDQHFVYRLTGDRVQRSEITIGSRAPGWVEVVDGLAAGDKVVARGVQGLSDGRQVEVLQVVSPGDPIRALQAGRDSD